MKSGIKSTGMARYTSSSPRRIRTPGWQGPVGGEAANKAQCVGQDAHRFLQQPTAAGVRPPRRSPTRSRRSPARHRRRSADPTRTSRSSSLHCAQPLTRRIGHGVGRASACSAGSCPKAARSAAAWSIAARAASPPGAEQAVHARRFWPANCESDRGRPPTLPPRRRLGPSARTLLSEFLMEGRNALQDFAVFSVAGGIELLDDRSFLARLGEAHPQHADGAALVLNPVGQPSDLGAPSSSRTGSRHTDCWRYSAPSASAASAIPAPAAWAAAPAVDVLITSQS